MSETQYLIGLDKLCSTVLDLDKNIQSVAVISKNGKAVEKKSKEGAAFQIPQERAEMLFMQRALEISMGRDFDDEYGPINYTYAGRENLSMYTFPVNEWILFVTSKDGISPISLANQIMISINSYRKSIKMQNPPLSKR
ncbi:MAG TPA: hypothetical protein VGR54_09660 [Nitrosopumilaceae archaeon]|nr:hypothetical protein [Nitrosopumilaceae archaeon]